MRVLVVAGGTGGHLYPGIAIAKELQSKGRSVLFATTNNELDKSILSRERVRFVSISATYYRGVRQTLRFLLRAPVSVLQAYKIIKRFKPDVIVLMGAYVSIPFVFSAMLSRIPIILCEQNVLPGRANRFLSRFAQKICVAFEESSRYFPRPKVVHTGNPVLVRKTAPKSVLYRKYKLDPKKTTILVFGGSGGASDIDSTIVRSLPMLRRRQIQFIHVTSRDVWVKTEYHRLRVPAAVLPYAFNMSELYTLADLVVCRAGGGTIAELAYYGRPAIIIPHPRTKQDHQVLNALLVQERNAGIVIPSNKLSPGILANALLRYLENEPLAKQRGKQIQLLGKRNAARLIVKEINKLPAVSLQESDNSNPS